MNLSEDYSREFYEMHFPWREDYGRIAESLIECFQFRTVIDLGCGNGYLIERLADLGKVVRGVEGSESAREFSLSYLTVHDLRTPLYLKPSDLAICMEVAEHLPEESANVLVDSICRASRHYVLFSAAAPGFGGHLHLNEQYKPYWRQKFIDRGFVWTEELTQKVVNTFQQKMLRHCWWFSGNAMVFERG